MTMEINRPEIEALISSACKVGRLRACKTYSSMPWKYKANASLA